MAIQINKRTAHDYELEYLNFVKIGVTTEHTRDLARAYKRDFPVEFSAFVKAFREGQRHVSQEYEPDLFRNFLSGFVQPVVPIVEPLRDLLGKGELKLRQPKTLGEQVAFGTGALTTTVAQAISMFKAVSLIPKIAKIAAHSPVLYQTAVRGIASFLQSGIIHGYEVGKGRKGLQDAARDIAMTVATSTISVLPENIVRKGFLNMASQVAVDLAADIGIDAARGIDVMSKEWWVNEIPRIGLSLGYGARDWASKGFVPHWNPTGESLISMKSAQRYIKAEKFKPREQDKTRKIFEGKIKAENEREEALAKAYGYALHAGKRSVEGDDPNEINNIDYDNLSPIPVPKKSAEDMKDQLRSAETRDKVPEELREKVLANLKRIKEDRVLDRVRRGPEQKILTGPEDISGRPVKESEPAATIQKIRSPEQFVEDMKEAGATGEIVASAGRVRDIARGISKKEFRDKIREDISDPAKLYPENQLDQVHNYAVNELSVPKMEVINTKLELQAPGELRPDGKRATSSRKNSAADRLVNGKIAYIDGIYHVIKGKKTREAFGDRETGEEAWSEALRDIRTDEAPFGYALGDRIPDAQERWLVPIEPDIVNRMRTSPEAVPGMAKQFLGDLRKAGFDIDEARAAETLKKEAPELASDISVHFARLKMFGSRYGTLTDRELADGYRALFDQGTSLDPDIVPPINAFRASDLSAKNRNDKQLLDKEGNPYPAAPANILYDPKLIDPISRSMGLDEPRAGYGASSITVRDGDKTLIIKGKMVPAHGKLLDAMREAGKDMIFFDSAVKVDRGFGDSSSVVVNPDNIFIKTVEYDLEKDSTYSRGALDFIPPEIAERVLSKSFIDPIFRWLKFTQEIETEQKKFSERIRNFLLTNLDFTSHRNAALDGAASELTPLAKKVVYDRFFQGEFVNLRQKGGARLILRGDVNNEVPPGTMAVPKEVYDGLRTKSVIAMLPQVDRPDHAQVFRVVKQPEGVEGNAAIANGADIARFLGGGLDDSKVSLLPADNFPKEYIDWLNDIKHSIGDIFIPVKKSKHRIGDIFIPVKKSKREYRDVKRTIEHNKKLSEAEEAVRILSRNAALYRMMQDNNLTVKAGKKSYAILSADSSLEVSPRLNVIRALKAKDKVSARNSAMSINKFLAVWSQAASRNGESGILRDWNFSEDKMLASLFGQDIRTVEGRSVVSALKQKPEYKAWVGTRDKPGIISLFSRPKDMAITDLDDAFKIIKVFQKAIAANPKTMGKSVREQIFNNISAKSPFPKGDTPEHKEAHDASIKELTEYVNSKHKKLTPDEEIQVNKVFEQIEVVKYRADKDLRDVISSERYEDTKEYDLEQNTETVVPGPNTEARNLVLNAGLTDSQMAFLSLKLLSTTGSRGVPWISFAIPRHKAGWDVLHKYFTGYNNSMKEINTRLRLPQDTEMAKKAGPVTPDDLDAIGRAMLGEKPNKIGNSVVKVFMNPAEAMSEGLVAGVMKTQNNEPVLLKADVLTLADSIEFYGKAEQNVFNHSQSTVEDMVHWIVERSNFVEKPLTVPEIRYLSRELVSRTKALKRIVKGKYVNKNGQLVWKPGVMARLMRLVYLPSEWMGTNKHARKAMELNGIALREHDGMLALLLPEIETRSATLKTPEAKDDFIDLMNNIKSATDHGLDSSAVEFFNWYARDPLPELSPLGKESKRTITNKKGKQIIINDSKGITVDRFVSDSIWHTYKNFILPRFKKQIELDPKSRQLAAVATHRRVQKAEGKTPGTKNVTSGTRDVDLDNLSKAEQKIAEEALVKPKEVIKFIMNNSRLTSMHTRYPLYDLPDSKKGDALSRKQGGALSEVIIEKFAKAATHKGNPLDIFSSFLPQLDPTKHAEAREAGTVSKVSGLNRNPGEDLYNFINAVSLWRFREEFRANASEALQKMLEGIPDDQVEGAKHGESLKAMADYFQKWAEDVVGPRQHGSTWEKWKADLVTIFTNLSVANKLGVSSSSVMRNKVGGIFNLLIYGGLPKLRESMKLALNPNHTIAGVKVGEIQRRLGIARHVIRPGVELSGATEWTRRVNNKISRLQAEKESRGYSRNFERIDSALQYAKEYSRRSAEWSLNHSMLAMAFGGNWTFTGTEQSLRTTAGVLGWQQKWDLFKEQWDANTELRKYYKNDLTKFEKDAQPELLKAASTMIDLTQFNYHTINTPELIRRSDVARLILQFRKWTINQTNLLYRNLGKPMKDMMGGKAAKEEIERAVRLMGAYALAGGASYFSANLAEWAEETGERAGGASGFALIAGGKAIRSVLPGGINFLNYLDNDFTEFAASLNAMLFGDETEKKYSFFGKDPFTWVAGPTLGLYMDALISFGMANEFRQAKFRWDALSYGLSAVHPVLGSRDLRRIIEATVDPRDLPEKWRVRDRKKSIRSAILSTFAAYPFDFKRKEKPWGGQIKSRDDAPFRNIDDAPFRNVEF